MQLICVAGEARHGKDTVSDYIIENYPNGVKLQFAYLLKKEACKLLKVSLDELNHYKDTNTLLYGKINVRVFLQELADTMRAVDEKVFVKYVQCAIRKMLKNGYSYVVVSDLRKHIELDGMNDMDLDMLSIRVERDNIEKIRTNNHNSETEVKDLNVDVVIKNNGTLEQLYNKVAIVMETKIK